MCLFTKLVRNPKYLPNKKNKGIVPKCDDERKLWLPASCGNCIECRKKKAREWKTRILHEIKEDKTGKFITLTFSEEALGELEKAKGSKGANEVAGLAIRRFLERWRKDKGKSVKHWFIVELGHTSTERIHLHGIIWTNEDKEYIKNKWMYGRIDIGYSMGERCVNYVMKYVTKTDTDHKDFIGKIFCSKGLGKGYLNTWDAKQNKYVPRGTNESYRLGNGAKINLPQYYRTKIYNEEEREALWIERLDKDEIYVLGNKIERISTEEGKKELEEALKYAQHESNKRGYGKGGKKKVYLTKNNIENLEYERIQTIFVETKEKRDRYKDKVNKQIKKFNNAKTKEEKWKILLEE